MKVVALLLITCLVLMPGIAKADEQSGFASRLSRAFELPAHRSLISRRLQSNADLSPFQSDGCSGGLSSAWRLVAGRFDGFNQTFDQAPPWEFCCVIHDRAYHNGVNAPEARASFDARLSADRALRACVARVGVTRREALSVAYGLRPDQVETAYAAIGHALFWAVRIGGGPCTGLAWRWGFGYRDCAIVFGGNN